MVYYKQTIQQVLEQLSSTKDGLTRQEAARRLNKYGPNSIIIKGEPLWRKLVEPFKSVFMLVLAIAAVISGVTHELFDAVIITLIILVSAVIYYAQRFSTERVLRALRQHDVQKIEVLRGGLQTISAEQLVPGDVVLLHEGQKVPADARVLVADNVRVDESLLTGESLPIAKHASALHEDKEVYERSNMLFQGSFVVSGDVTAVVVGTGNATEFGKLAALTQNSETESPVQKKINRLMTQIVAIVAAVAVVAFVLALVRGMEFFDSLSFMLALSVSAVPEGLPVAISVVLVLGMRHLAKRKALVRNMAAIENVGVLTTIATDKTGTLTKNKLSVQDAWVSNSTDITALAETARLSINQNNGASHDPLDTAMSGFATKYKVHIKQYEHVKSMPFEQQFAMSGNVWKNGTEYVAHIKGAPEHVIAKSGLVKFAHAAAEKELHSLTGKGYRVIALAAVEGLRTSPADLSELQSKKFIFKGLLAVADELRPEAKASVAATQKAGVTVRMITGDHFETAYAIGKQLGMVEHRGQVFDSRSMPTMSDSHIEKAVADARVFSRVTPEYKHRILTILKKHDITAMTGDGVNDVPALANAHIGVAMGSGSQIAKEAGDIVLLDDNFKSITTALREGRIIFTNIRRMLAYLFATSSGEVITMLGALVFGMPLPLVPVQILWVNLVTDTAMVIPLGLEPAERDVMKRKPRNPKKPIIGRVMASRLVLVAFTMAIVTLSMFGYFLQTHSEEYARTIAFSVLVVMQWANAFNARSEWQSVFARLRVMNSKFYVGLAIAIALQIAAVFGPLQHILHLVPVALADLLVTGAIAVAAIIIVSELHKLVGRRWFDKD